MNRNEGNPAPIDIYIMYPKTTKENRIESLIFTSICWLFTLTIWIFIILLIVINSRENKTEKISDFYVNFSNYPRKQKLKIIFPIVFFLLYIIYLIIEFSSPLLKYLYNKEKEKTIVEKMNSLFKKIPSLKLISNIKNHNYITNNYKYKIKSSRDISGNLILNIKDNYKKYIFLNLKLEIIFDDENTSSDYIIQKEKFIKDHNEEKGKLKVKEEIRIKEMYDYNTIKIYDNDSILVHHYIYIFSAILTFAELYKIYLYCISIYEEFTIRKVVSLRNDLSQCQEYNKFTPKVKIIKEKINEYIVPINNFQRQETKEDFVNSNIDNNEIKNNDGIIESNRKMHVDNGGYKSNNILENPYKKKN